MQKDSLFSSTLQAALRTAISFIKHISIPPKENELNFKGEKKKKKISPSGYLFLYVSLDKPNFKGESFDQCRTEQRA